MMEVRTNIIDRMVAAFSPQRAADRLVARARLQAATALTSKSPTEPGGRIFGRGGYNGGDANRRQTRGWRARLRSANQDVLGDQRTVIARARHAAMNMPLATAAVERPITFTVGTGLMAIPDLDAARLGISEEQALELSSQIAADYDNYMASKDADAERTATGYALQEIILRGVLESGDVLVVRCMPEDQIGRRHETAWKLYEADRIVSPANHTEGERIVAGKPGAGNICAGGVEVDDYGAPIAYHVLKKASETAGGSLRAGRTGDDTVRFAAWGEKSGLPTAFLVMAKRRPEQFRGASILAPVLEALQQVSTLTEAELFAAILQGMLAVTYKSPGAMPLPEPDYEVADPIVTGGLDRGLDDASRPLANYRLEAGTVLEIDAEDEVDVKTPGRPNPAFDPFFTAIAKQIAAAIEVPYEVLMLSFTASYSASRGAIEVFYLTVFKRREWLASMSEAIRYRAWLYEQVAKGVYRMAGFLQNGLRRELWSNVRFRGDGKISLDPTREAKALEVHEAHAWQTSAEITAGLTGGDYDANVRRRAGEHKRWVGAGLPIPNAKGGGAEPAPGPGEAGDKEKPEDEE